ncbi:conserved hypothetical protein [Chlorobium limicola DSM 245]|uniref:Glycosyl transferase group 1 n=1 Tax=Chlorobium limicola (strain DSM 245 / NBRC 103803 / 6330) TaxID=290315 RepID=B3EH97_CHLL2|nr:hypothetical protein [Chlorobium limicola]ACD91259.1 conserved hypothetical protein [Chlorobium limicola DSM 245]
MKKILFLSVNYPPMLTEGSSRASRFVAKLPELGWVPLVVAPADVAWGDADKSRAQPESSEYTGIYRTGEIMDGSAFGPDRTVQLLQGMSVAGPSGLPLRMISGLLPGVSLVSGWEKHAASVVSEIISRHDSVDAIYAQGPPAAPLLLALDLSAKYGVPVLFDLVSPVDGVSLPGSTRNDAAKIEERVLTSGHTIMTPTRALKEFFLKKYFGKITYDDLSIVPDFCSVPPELARLAAQKPDGAMQLLIFSELVSGKHMKSFVQALGGFMQDAGVFRGTPVVRIIGGESEELLKHIRKHLPDAQVSCSHRLQEREELEAVAGCDVFCLASGKDEPADMTLPSRMVDALCLRKKLLVIGQEGPAAQLALETGGFFASIHDTPAVIQAFQAAVDSFRQGDRGMADLQPERFTSASCLTVLSKLLAYMLPV